MNAFTLAEGLVIQGRDIEQWRHVLNTRTFEKLQAEAASRNADVKEEWGDTGYDVWRGRDIDEWISREAARLATQSRERKAAT